MNELLNRALNLETLRWGAEGVRFGLERSLPAWGWALIVAGTLALAFWSYVRLDGARAARMALASVRAVLLLALALLAAGPQLVQRSESVERDWVIAMVDRSASLTIEDVPLGQAGSPRIAREEQMRSAIARTWPAWESLANERTVVWLGFDGGAFDLPAAGSGDGAVVGNLRFQTPTGVRTAIGASLEQALTRAAARPLSAVVVMSDGRSLDEISRASLRRLQSERVPVHAVALGSREAVGDYAVRRVDSPRLAFVEDITPVRVDLERIGVQGSGAATIRLIDRATQRVLDEQRVTFTGDAESVMSSVTLVSRPEEAGSREWSVEIEPDGADLIAGNNTRAFEINLVDRPLRVLYIDGYPRWEQRYLRNLLMREQSITSSSLLLATDRRYTQEGNIEIDMLPDSSERWAEFDVIILGDVRPEVFTYEQLVQLREHIALRGAGLIWIAGPSATPIAWEKSPLEDLVPFVRGATDGASVVEPVVMLPTAAADRFGVLRLADDPAAPWPAQLESPETGWSQIKWTQRIDPRGLKPTTEVIASGRTIYSGGEIPLVLAMRYGAGRSLYVATDEIWRWRYARGEQLPERFWLQFIRMLGRESLARSGTPALLEITPRRSFVNQPVRVGVELLDQSLVELALPSISVELERLPEPGEYGRSIAEEIVLRPDGPERRSYSSVWLPSQAGRWKARPTEPLLAGFGLEADAEVALPDDELRRPETDHEGLARLASATGGRVFQPEELERLFTEPEHLPKRRVVLWNEVTESLWDTPATLVLIVFLLTLEWVGRRVIRLI